jgi:hypothetical protein
VWTKLIVTNQRLVFVPPIEGPLLGILVLLLMAAGSASSFELTEIDGFHTWTPAFSGPPMFQIGTDGWTFALMRSAFSFRVQTRERIKEHFEVVEEAWKAAKAAQATPAE